MDSMDEEKPNIQQQLRPFACVEPGCSKAFARRSDLVRHCRIHSNDRPFVCTWEGCTRDFIQRSALTVHVRVHTGERPHKCEYEGCIKAFSDSSSLARHRRIHTGKRPYCCLVPTCRKTFCRKTTLTKHSKKHHPGLTEIEGTNFNDEVFEDDLVGSSSSHPRWELEGSYASTEPSTPSDNRESLEASYGDRSPPDPPSYGTNTYATRRTSYKSNQPRQVWNPDTHEPETSRSLRSHVISATRSEPVESTYLALPDSVKSTRKKREVSHDPLKYEEHSTYSHSPSPYPQEPQIYSDSPQFVQNNLPEYSTPSYQFLQQQYSPTPYYPQYSYTPSISQYRQLQQQQQHQQNLNFHPQQVQRQFHQFQNAQEFDPSHHYHQHSHHHHHSQNQFYSDSQNEEVHSTEFYRSFTHLEPTSPSPYSRFRRASSTSALELPSGMVGSFSSELGPRRYSLEADLTGQHHPNLLAVEEEYILSESTPMSFGNSNGYFSSVEIGERRQSIIGNSFGNLANSLNFRSGAMGGSSFSSYITQHIDSMTDESLTLSY